MMMLSPFFLQLPMFFDNELDLSGSLNSLFFSFLKVLFVTAGLLYVVFAIIIVRQIHTMQQSLVTSFSSKIGILGYIHLVLAILVLLFFMLGL